MDTDTGDRHILQITFGPSYVITYYKIANQQKAIEARQYQIADSKVPVQIANWKLPIENCQLIIPNCKLQIAIFQLQMSNFELQNANC